MRTGALVLSLGILAATCAPSLPSAPPPGTPAASPSPAGSAPTASAAPSATATAVPTVPPPPTAPPSAESEAPTSPLPTDPGLRLDPATVLQVCSRYPADDGEARIECEDGIRLGFQTLAADAARVSRADFGFSCEGDGCQPPSPSRAYASFWGPGVARRVTLAFSEADGLVAVASSAAGSQPAAPAFTPPAVSRPIVAGEPAWVANRTAYPLCGDETAGMAGPFDTAARQCFLDGVLAGQRVEFVSRSQGTEGGAFIEIDRYDRSGGITAYIMSDGAWSAYRTGITLAGVDLVFSRGGGSAQLHP